MSTTGTTMSTKAKCILIIISVVILLTIGCIVYRMFFQFDHKEVMIYAREEATKYTDKATAYTLIMEGVNHVLGSHSLTQMVLRSARATKTDPEQELVNTAINLCVALKYLASSPVAA